MVNGRKLEELELKSDIPYFEECIKYINKKLNEGITEEDIVKSYSYLVRFEAIKRSMT